MIRRTTWEIASFGGLALAEVMEAGLYFFVYRSKSVGAVQVFCLTAAGAGMGGNQAGFSSDDFSGLVFSDAGVKRPFSVRMLYLRGGAIASAGLGVKQLPVNFGGSWVEAVKDTQTMFRCSGFGTTLGSSSGVLLFNGIWYSCPLNNNSFNPWPPVRNYFTNGAEDFARTVVQGIQKLYGVPYR